MKTRVFRSAQKRRGNNLERLNKLGTDISTDNEEILKLISNIGHVELSRAEVWKEIMNSSLSLLADICKSKGVYYDVPMFRSMKVSECELPIRATIDRWTFSKHPMYGENGRTVTMWLENLLSECIKFHIEERGLSRYDFHHEIDALIENFRK